jgi:Transposase IS200 like
LYSSWRRNSNGLASKIERFSPDFCCSLSHVSDLQVLDTDNDVVFADVVRDLVYAQMPAVTNIFVTEYRRKVFDGNAIQRLKTIFEKVCTDFEAQLVEMDLNTYTCSLTTHRSTRCRA